MIGASRSVVKGNLVGFADEELGKMTLAHARSWHSHQRGPFLVAVLTINAFGWDMEGRSAHVWL
ncbi:MULTISPECIES: hypothetical protein [unclassified Bradyrhizobium]|uniref:hypothetical protein n=1 Tax=unclassified Bradyrhizobium TaxID=2631580 RepID=UPI0012FCC63B|nr:MULTISPECIES: hypothetical protein [unclassified Bradyrhizobium]MCK1357198.1 hypothetical protein [Bradyrhizobium sp. CW7]MCK1413234.1 hypothetical protein [Bradyrhizobium sp. CW4]MCK1425751.1 hypothetical protein [Bradyrhizobium sp. 87]MCK1577060.1 hypothetical protein [Bradyrhizobium sp. 174]MCK1710608.1 hypothetical protein [Bradyrhizobium sp. 143]